MTTSSSSSFTPDYNMPTSKLFSIATDSTNPALLPSEGFVYNLRGVISIEQSPHICEEGETFVAEFNSLDSLNMIGIRLDNNFNNKAYYTVKYNDRFYTVWNEENVVKDHKKISECVEFYAEYFGFTHIYVMVNASERKVEMNFLSEGMLEGKEEEFFNWSDRHLFEIEKTNPKSYYRLIDDCFYYDERFEEDKTYELCVKTNTNDLVFNISVSK